MIFCCATARCITVLFTNWTARRLGTPLQKLGEINGNSPDPNLKQRPDSV